MAWDSVWEDIFANGDWGIYPSEELIRFIARNFYKRKREDVKILEVGFGVGANIWYMAREGFDVYGIEASVSGMNKCTKMLEKNSLNATLLNGDITNMDFPQNMDAIIDVECLCCNSTIDTDKILYNIEKSLSSGGLFFSRTITDNMYIGKENTKHGELEYSNVSDGPIANKGFVRLLSEKGIDKLYGKYFDILSIDKSEYTINNRTMNISEWNIICKKKA